MQIIKKGTNYLPLKRITKPLFEGSIALDDVSKMQHVDINTWLKGDILTKADRMSMAHSLELRVPFLDNEVFEVASKLMKEDKIKKETTKYLLREAFQDELPDSVIHRKKLGYPVPIRIWLKNELYDWALNLMNEDFVEDFFEKKEIIAMLHKHRTGKIDYSRKIWTILTFIIWAKMIIKQ